MIAVGLAAALVLGAAPAVTPVTEVTQVAPVAPAPAAAGTANARSTGPAASQPPPTIEVLPAAPPEGPDVELHVPRAEVQKLSLDVENLNAKLDVDTSVARLVEIHAGVVATVQKLKAELDGVSAETHLVVRLNRVAEVMQRALATIDGNPQLAGGPIPSGLPAVGVGAEATVPAAPSSK